MWLWRHGRLRPPPVEFHHFIGWWRVEKLHFSASVLNQPGLVVRYWPDLWTMNSKQALAIGALLQGASRGKAAEAAGVSERTLRRWSGDPEFIAALRAAEASAFDDLAHRLTAGASGALAVLAELARAEDVAASIRLRAAVEWIGFYLKVREAAVLAEIEARLQDLEAQNETRNN